MNDINIEILKIELPKLIKALEEISNINPYAENSISGYILCQYDNVIGIKTESYYSGCGTETNTTYVDINELRHPLSYFREKFGKMKDDENKKAMERQEIEKKLIEKREKEEYSRLKDKYGSNEEGF